MCCVHVYAVYLLGTLRPASAAKIYVYILYTRKCTNVCIYSYLYIYINIWYNHIPVYVHCSSLTSVCVQLHTTCLPWCFCPIADTPLQIWLFWPWRRRKSLKLTRSSDIGNCIQWMDVWCCAPFVQTYIIIPENSTAASHHLFRQECNLNLRPHFSLRKIDSNRFTGLFLLTQPFLWMSSLQSEWQIRGNASAAAHPQVVDKCLEVKGGQQPY